MTGINLFRSRYLSQSLIDVVFRMGWINHLLYEGRSGVEMGKNAIKREIHTR